MGCESCGTKSGGTSPGCKSNGTCGTSGCNKLNVYDWFNDVILPEDYKPFDVVELRFKGSKKLFVRNVNQLDLYTGDLVTISSDLGYDIGRVSLSGELVKLHLKKYGVEEDIPEMRHILHKSTEQEIAKYEEQKNLETRYLEQARTIAMELKLKMKISDIEMQADGKKVTFYYTSEGRVDFRELIKRYASAFKCRIEMRQVSYREEASRLGGIGSCGRELCCSTWLTDYKVVSVGAAKKQNLSINMLKLSGQCGRLKCCLNYELELYTEFLAEFPKEDVILRTASGNARMRKIDILKKVAWYSYDGSNEWIPIDLERVNKIIRENQKGKKPNTLIDQPMDIEIEKKTLEFAEDLLLNRDDDMDKKVKQAASKNKQNKRRHSKNKNQNQKNTQPKAQRNQNQKANQNNNPSQNNQKNRPNRNKRRPNNQNPKSN
jgi:cell fate regulator YaaT (PSP1 superfamily)